MDITLEPEPELKTCIKTAIWFSPITDEAREYLHCSYHEDPHKMHRDRIQDANHVHYIQGILPSSKMQLKKSDFVRVMLLPALPRKPQFEDAQLLYRYMAEGLRPYNREKGLRCGLDIAHTLKEIDCCLDNNGLHREVAIDG